MTPGDRVWVNGDLVDPTAGVISVFDHGFTVGDGVFETMKVVTPAGGGRHAFALTRHLARLRRSAAGLGLDVPVGDAALREAVTTVIASTADAGRVRVTVTGGVGPLGSNRAGTRPTIVVAASAHDPWPPTTSVATVPWRRNEHSAVAGLKTTSYAENVVALRDAHHRGADEAIFANTEGNVCEGTGSNVFVAFGGRLVTPPLASGCLAGVTRELVIDLVDVEEIDVPLEEFATVTEAFLTSSTRDVHPIERVDRIALSCPGPLTLAAAAAFADLVARDIDP